MEQPAIVTDVGRIGSGVVAIFDVHGRDVVVTERDEDGYDGLGVAHRAVVVDDATTRSAASREAPPDRAGPFAALAGSVDPTRAVADASGTGAAGPGMGFDPARGRPSAVEPGEGDVACNLLGG